MFGEELVDGVGDGDALLFRFQSSVFGKPGSTVTPPNYLCL
jgi:hypothetical protein